MPLIEIVSEPDIRSAADAGRYLRELRQIMLYVGVSDVNMEEGSLRVDANVSAREHGAAELGTKTEVKNLNSFSNVERALAAEFARQMCAAGWGRAHRAGDDALGRGAWSGCGRRDQRRKATTTGISPSPTCPRSS